MYSIHSIFALFICSQRHRSTTSPILSFLRSFSKVTATSSVIFQVCWSLCNFFGLQKKHDAVKTFFFNFILGNSQCNYTKFYICFRYQLVRGESEKPRGHQTFARIRPPGLCVGAECCRADILAVNHSNKCRLQTTVTRYPYLGKGIGYYHLLQEFSHLIIWIYLNCSTWGKLTLCFR